MRLTRAVRIEDLPDLVARPRTAALAFINDGEPEIVPVRYTYDGGRHLVGLPAASQPPVGRVKLVVDDGRWWFDLHGFWLRGTLDPYPRPPEAAADLAWFELAPEKTVAWHYGRMREQAS